MILKLPKFTLCWTWPLRNPKADQEIRTQFLELARTLKLTPPWGFTSCAIIAHHKPPPEGQGGYTMIVYGYPTLNLIRDLIKALWTNHEIKP